MRHVQYRVERFKKYTTFTLSFSVLIVIWIVGAIVFWQLEKGTQGMTFFEAFYFCYVSLTTIGYGDFTPQSAAGRPFFVVWSLFAVPSITILIGAASNTVVDSFNNWTNKIADFTLLPKHGIWRDFINRHDRLLGWAKARQERIEADDRVESGFPTGPAEEDNESFRPKTVEELALENPNRDNRSELGRRLAHAIKQVTQDIKNDPQKRYSYEEWVEWTILIRFSSQMEVQIQKEVDKENLSNSDIDQGLIEWDWLGEDSPMMAEMTEPEWLLDRLIESMARYTRNIVAFLRIERERGYVIDTVSSLEGSRTALASTESQSSAHSNKSTTWRLAAAQDGRAPDQISVDMKEATKDEREAQTKAEGAAQKKREEDVEGELAQEEKTWDADYERKNGRCIGMPQRESQEHSQGLPGFLGELDNAWRRERPRISSCRQRSG